VSAASRQADQILQLAQEPSQENIFSKTVSNRSTGRFVSISMRLIGQRQAIHSVVATSLLRGVQALSGN
jgi:hypothetical protein